MIPHAGVTPSARPDPRTNYIPCPECAVLMNRKNFGGTSGVVVDVCKKHGTWFDEGELPRVIAFVAGGGLERARAREAAEAERLRHEAMVASSPLSRSGGPMSHDGFTGLGEVSRGDSLVEIFLHLLG